MVRVTGAALTVVMDSLVVCILYVRFNECVC